MSTVYHNAVSMQPATLLWRARWCLLLLWLIVGGCAQRSGFDPSGRRLLDYGPAVQPTLGNTVPNTTAPVPLVSAGNVPVATVPVAVALPGVSLTPGRLVAPVGNEVLLVSAVHQPGRPQAPYQRVEWLLAPQGVGTFLATGRSDRPIFGGSAYKLDNSYAVSETAGIARVLTRGTATPTDDVSIVPGQSWVSMTSPTEGVSYVTAFAPDLQAVSSNRQSAVIYWVDARWSLSPTRTVRTGTSAPLTVSVYRQSTGQPVPNWRVRYAISNGPPANLSAGGAQTAEVITNTEGKAIVDLTQVSPQVGTNLVTVELIRPTEAAPGSTEPLLVGTATTQVIWSDTAAPGSDTIVVPGTTPAPTLPGNPVIPSQPGPTPAQPSPQPAPAPFRVMIRGPAGGTIGQEAEFLIAVQNLSNQTLSGLTLTPQFDPGLELRSGNQPTPKKLDPIEAGKSTEIPIFVRATKTGQLCQNVVVTDPNGLSNSAKGCYNVVANAAGINSLPRYNMNVTSSNGRTLQLGQQNLFTINVENNSDEKLAGMQVVVEFDSEISPGQVSQSAVLVPKYDPVTRRLTWAMPDLPPNSREKLEIETLGLNKLTAPNRPARIRVTAQAGNGPPIVQESTIEVTPPRAAAPTDGSRTDIGFRRTEGAQVKVGTFIDYEYTLVNMGNAPDRNLVFTLQVPNQLKFREQDIAGPLRPTINGQTITFAAVPELLPTIGTPPAAAPIVIRIRCLAEQAGNAEMKATLTTQAQPQGISYGNKVEIYTN